MINNNIDAGSIVLRCALRDKIEVTGNDADIKREFERIEQAERRTPKTSAQTKTPSVGADGV